MASGVLAKEIGSGIAVLTWLKYTAENLTPNPFPTRVAGVRIKASLLEGERFGERSDCISSNREGIYVVFLPNHRGTEKKEIERDHFEWLNISG